MRLNFLSVHSRVGEKVLQITGQLQPRGAAVEQEVREAEQLAVGLGDQCIHGLVLVEETCPSGGGDFRRQRRVALTAIKGVVAGPEGFPGGEVGGLEGADEDGGHHK